MEIGIIGLPNVGKSSLFNVLVESQVRSSLSGSVSAKVGDFPFTTIDPNIGAVEVKDERLDILAVSYRSAGRVPATIKFVDVAGLVKNAAQGEGLGNQFLNYIRGVDAIAEVVRCFENQKIAHVAGKINPEEDIRTINTELLLADLEQARRALEHIETKIKKYEKEAIESKKLLLKVIDFINAGRSLRLDRQFASSLKSFNFLSAKPLLYIANVGEKMDLSKIHLIERIAKTEGAKVVPVAVKTELEILELPEDERENYRRQFDLSSSFNEVIRAGYQILDLVTFFTANAKEVRAWTVRRGTNALQAASKVHTDFGKGFIRAEVFSVKDLSKYKSEKAIREAGKLRSEGKDYAVKDGDVIKFLFSP